MPQTCTVCRHEALEAFDTALVAGEPLRDIAGRTGLSKSSLGRHKDNCLSATAGIGRYYGFDEKLAVM